MIGLGAGALKIFVALEPQDLRKSFQGLTELALGHLGERLTREVLGHRRVYDLLLSHTPPP